MTTQCPNGHDSEWPDWCSVCGEQLSVDGASPEAAPSAPSASSPVASSPVAESTAATSSGAAAAGGPTCDNCGVPRHEHDVFCESCGLDFASGSLPEAADQPHAAGATSDAPEAAAPMHVKISVDAAFFTATVGDVDLALPDPLPETQIVPLTGIRILIGRQSTSRGIFPEIDAQQLTGDPAVSSRHAVLERSTDGTWTLTDLGSTNGTFLTVEAVDAVEVGVTHPLTTGDVFFLGAWTRIELAATT